MLRYVPLVPSLSQVVLMETIEEWHVKTKPQKWHRFWHWTEIADRLRSRVMKRVLCPDPEVRVLMAIEDFVWIGKRRNSCIPMAKLVSWLHRWTGSNQNWDQGYRAIVYTPGQWRKRLDSRFYEEHNSLWLDQILRMECQPQDAHQDDAFGLALTAIGDVEEGEIHVL